MKDYEEIEYPLMKGKGKEMVMKPASEILHDCDMDIAKNITIDISDKRLPHYIRFALETHTVHINLAGPGHMIRLPQNEVVMFLTKDGHVHFDERKERNHLREMIQSARNIKRLFGFGLNRSEKSIRRERS